MVNLGIQKFPIFGIRENSVQDFFFFFKYGVNQEVANTKLSKPLAFFSAVSLTSSSVMVPSSQLQPGWPFCSSSSTLQAFTLVFCSCYFFCLQFSSSR